MRQQGYQTHEHCTARCIPFPLSLSLSPLYLVILTKTDAGAKVGQAQMPLASEQQIVGLDVPGAHKEEGRS